MRARSHRRPDPEKQHVPPFGGGTWQAFYAVGGHCQPSTRRQGPPERSPGAAQKSDCKALIAEHVDATTRTLAPESRHIVAFGLPGTPSRAAVSPFFCPSV